jgi:hypothetical protein
LSTRIDIHLTYSNIVRGTESLALMPQHKF